MPGRERPGMEALRATPSFGREDVDAFPRPKDGVAEGPSAGSFTARRLYFALSAYQRVVMASPSWKPI